MYLTDKQVIDKIQEGELEIVILNYIPFANYLADRVSQRSFTHERVDIRGEAYVALIAGVNVLKGHPNPRAFLREKIKGHIINFVKRSHLIKTPDGEDLMYNPFDCDVFDSEFGCDDNEESVSANRGTPKQCWDEKHEDTIVRDDLVSNFLFSDIEKKIIQMRVDGYTLEEVSVECKIPYVQIHRILQGMKNRVVKVLDGDY
jgi:DNA-directed RNA polymerase specialized sigma24 family protein